MSWMQALYETYEACCKNTPTGSKKLMPISHTTQQAHIEVVLDECGEFRRAQVIKKGDDTTLIPCTEESAGRAGSKPVNHPLCDKLQYLAQDFTRYGGVVTTGFIKDSSEPYRLYLSSLSGWAESSFTHPKLKAILKYVKKGTLIADLVKQKILPTNNDGTKLLTEWTGNSDKPAIFGVMNQNQVPEHSFVRWRVEISDNPQSATWDDQELITSWINYYADQQTKLGLCMTTGCDGPLAVQHPAKIRHAGDKAKLISSNDKMGYTFRGRFHDADQAAGVSFEITQKAHNALRWLIERQAYKHSDQVILAWAISGKSVPDPFQDTMALFMENQEISSISSSEETIGDVGQTFALRLKKLIQGYHAELATDNIVVMGLDSATPGRMAISFYRELKGADFLQHIEEWHANYSWHQNFKGKCFIGTPALHDIAESAYGIRLDDRLRKLVIERLLPCIIDAQPFPFDVLQATFHRTCQKAGTESWEWEKRLGIICALFRGYSLTFNTEYFMTLEIDRTTRDYLYGRLLAIADNIEQYALTKAEKQRETSAAKLMHRFSMRPFSTWKTIYMALAPYKSRLRTFEQGTGFLIKRERLLDEIHCSFPSNSFSDDSPLSAEFLLGYHCQRQQLYRQNEPDQSGDESAD